MPAAQVIDLSPTPNRYGKMFGEGFANRFNELDERRRNNQWFEDAIGDEQDPLQQAIKLSNSKHPFDPEYVKEKRQQLFDNAEFLQEKAEKDRIRKKEKDSSDKEARTLSFLEQQMKLEPGTLAGTDPKLINEYVRSQPKPSKSGPAANDPAVKFAYEEYKKINDGSNAADATLKTVKEARDAIEKGGGDLSGSNLLGKMIPWFKSGETATLENASVELFKHFKQIFPRMTNVDVGLIEDVLPAVGKSREANNAILDIYESAGNLAKEKQRIADELIEAINTGEIPAYQFKRILRESIDNVEDQALDSIRQTAEAFKSGLLEQVEPGYTAMISSSGDVAQIPNDRVEEALKSKRWSLYGR